MRRIWYTFFELLRLRTGPQELPCSIPWLTRLAVFSLVVDVFATQVLETSHVSLLQLLVSLGIGLLLPWGVLSLRGLQARYVQTMTALLGTGIFLSLLFLPVASWTLSSGLVESKVVTTPEQTLLGWVVIGLVLWKVMVSANIWRHALNATLLRGIAVAISLLITEILVDHWLFPPAVS